MDRAAYELTLENGRKIILVFWFSDNEAVTEDCDACIGWTACDPDTKREIDGGEMDYNEAAAGYSIPDDAAKDLIDYIGSDLGAPVSAWTKSDADPDDYL